ncbi:hypothetical protein GCM10010168_79330 [Actinoplanes ianthinogenes]|uniref:Uncharacterized protein n=1 Tax=Actinoplanes ianthinogenes TaxID=122358 RepID=A0ABM7LK30_9ACTN|nr:hypothetical protein Aiant_02690 [Actinoplanes ianthinogenes]GGR48553.1 hypothetical protein GCM10010168_79330 [Actinoplanes ianthinogenes]
MPSQKVAVRLVAEFADDLVNVGGARFEPKAVPARLRWFDLDWVHGPILTRDSATSGTPPSGPGAASPGHPPPASGRAGGLYGSATRILTHRRLGAPESVSRRLFLGAAQIDGQGSGQA